MRVRPSSLLKCVTLLYIAFFVGRRSIIYGRTWWNSSVQFSKDMRILEELCPFNRDLLENHCAEAKLFTSVWPSTRAFEATYDSIFLCLDVPCSELLPSQGTIILVALAAAPVVFVLLKMGGQKRVGQKCADSMLPNYFVPTHYLENGAWELSRLQRRTSTAASIQ